MKKLAIVTTHPVQYNVPWIVRLAQKDIQIKVFYTYEQAGNGAVYDSGFGKDIKWDIPLLDGYDYEFVPNKARKPGLVRFMGIVNPSLIKKIEAYDPDQLLVIGWNYHSHLQVMRHFHRRIPIYFRGDSVLLHEKTLWRKMARRLFLTWVYRHIDFVFYVGANNKSYFQRHGVRDHQLIFSPQAIDIDRFSEPDRIYKDQAHQWKQRLGIPAGNLTVLFAGKMIKVKNPTFLIELAEATKHLPISFVMVGDGILLDDVKRQAAGNPNILFVDFQNQTVMPSVYRIGDVYIMPSFSETWGMGINEAMACGVPVMASDRVGCAVDLVLENKTGMTFRLDEIGKCVDFLQHLLDNPEHLAEMGNCASALIQFFSFAQIVDSVSRTMSMPMTEQRRRQFLSAAL
jgi:glycosyltransferase involved in cell wall biosynthesis